MIERPASVDFQQLSGLDSPPAVRVARYPGQFAVPANLDHAILVTQGDENAAVVRVDDRAVGPFAGSLPTLGWSSRARPVRSTFAGDSRRPVREISRSMRPSRSNRTTVSLMKRVQSSSGRSSGRRSTESAKSRPGSGLAIVWCSFPVSRGFRPVLPKISESNTTAGEAFRRCRFPRPGRRLPSPAAYRMPNGGSP